MNWMWMPKPVASDFFTKATWRAGKHGKMRKRVNHYAGCKVAPAAFLEAGKRNAFKPGRPGYRVRSDLRGVRQDRQALLAPRVGRVRARGLGAAGDGSG